MSNLTLTISLLGEGGVGKTSLTRRFIDDEFTDDYRPTMGVEKRRASREINGRLLSLEVLDNPGQQNQQTIAAGYLREADGLILIFDVTDRSSFDSVRGWVNRINEYVVGVQTILVANKCDRDDRDVDQDAGQELATEFGFQYFEVSALSGDNVQDVFMNFASVVDQNRPRHKNQQNQAGQPVVIAQKVDITKKEDPEEKKEKRCCQIM